MTVSITRADSVALCGALGFKTASKWNKDRMLRKLKDLAELAGDGGIEVPEDVEDADNLSAILAELVDSEGDVDVVDGVKAAKETAKPKKQPAPPVAEEDVEDEEDEEDDGEDEEDEEEEAVTEKKTKGKGKQAPKAKKTGKREPSCFSVSMELMCKNPDMPFEKLKTALEKKGLFKMTSARTAASSVKMVVAGLRKSGLMN